MCLTVALISVNPPPWGLLVGKGCYPLPQSVLRFSSGTPDLQGLSWAVFGPQELDAKARVALKGITVARKQGFIPAVPA